MYPPPYLDERESWSETILVGNYYQKAECPPCCRCLVIVTKCGAVVDLLTTITS